jgi:hypothetical protein
MVIVPLTAVGLEVKLVVNVIFERWLIAVILVPAATEFENNPQNNTRSIINL